MKTIISTLVALSTLQASAEIRIGNNGGYSGLVFEIQSRVAKNAVIQTQSNLIIHLVGLRRLDLDACMIDPILKLLQTTDIEITTDDLPEDMENDPRANLIRVEFDDVLTFDEVDGSHYTRLEFERLMLHEYFSLLEFEGDGDYRQSSTYRRYWRQRVHQDPIEVLPYFDPNKYAGNIYAGHTRKWWSQDSEDHLLDLLNSTTYPREGRIYGIVEEAYENCTGRFKSIHQNCDVPRPIGEDGWPDNPEGCYVYNPLPNAYEWPAGEPGYDPDRIPASYR